MSLSSERSDGSIATFFTAYLQVIVTFTRPAPAWPSISIFASSSCAFFMFSCICCACFIKAPNPPFGIIASPLVAGWVARRLGGADRRRHDFGAQVLHQALHERVFLDGLGRARLALLHLAGLHRGHTLAAGGAHAHREPEIGAEVRRELALQLVHVRLLRVHAM